MFVIIGVAVLVLWCIQQSPMCCYLTKLHVMIDFFDNFQSKISLEGLEDKSMEGQPPLPTKGDPSKYSELKGQLGTTEGIVA